MITYKKQSGAQPFIPLLLTGVYTTHLNNSKVLAMWWEYS